LRAAFGLLRYFVRALAIDTDLWNDTVWVADPTPIECGRSRETVRRSALAGWAGYGYCRSHTRYFWGLRLHLVTTLHGLPVAFALANPATVPQQPRSTANAKFGMRMRAYHTNNPQDQRTTHCFLRFQWVRHHFLGHY